MRTPRSYHHGNLKQALLEAALKLIRKVGSGAFTLREVARQAGVSHNAPYRHFRDKEALLAAVATEGFNRLTESLEAAAAPASNGMERFRLSGRGYVQFALSYPQHFAVMFDAPRRFDRYPETRAAGERAFGTLVRYIEDCQAEGSLPKGDSMPLALLAWSVVHGIAKLAIGGQLPMPGTEEILQFTDWATQTLALGKAKPAGRTIPLLEKERVEGD
jgi:AcrR family transcriptional regulator